MAGLGALAERCLLHFDEIADEAVLFHHRTGPQAGIGADRAALAHRGALEVAEGTDARTAGDLHPGAEHDIGLDGHIGREFGVPAEEDRFGGL